jgi:hypothetical protein
MTAPIIQQDKIKALLILEREFRQKKLKVDGIQLGPLQKKALPRGWFDGTLDIEVLELVRPWSHRFDTAHGTASALPRQQAKPTFILTTDSHRVFSRWLRQSLDVSEGVLQQVCNILLNCCHFFRVFF